MLYINILYIIIIIIVNTIAHYQQIIVYFSISLSIIILNSFPSRYIIIFDVQKYFGIVMFMLHTRTYYVYIILCYRYIYI